MIKSRHSLLTYSQVPFRQRLPKPGFILTDFSFRLHDAGTVSETGLPVEISVRRENSKWGTSHGVKRWFNKT